MTAEPCPDANLLVRYVGHRLGDEAQSSVERHLDGCSSCLSLLSEIARGDEASGPQPVARDEIATANALFGKYRLESVVGQGAMGTVYVAHDESLQRRVALKILRIHADAEGARTRLMRESRAMAKLSHPNVVTVYEAGERDGRLYIAMELIAGSTLAAWRSFDRRSWQDGMAILVRAGEGLLAAHRQGLVHRDFKPENVLLGVGTANASEPRVVVTDFGLVAASGQEAVDPEGASGPLRDLALTRTGMVVGTPRYMSPEQFAGRTIDARSDQFSFAVTLYETLYGFRPFVGGSIEELRTATTRGNVLPPPAKTPVPAAVHAALLQALASDPERRHPSLDDLLQVLRSFATSPADRGPPAPPSRAGRMKARGASFFVAMAALLTVALTAFVSSRRTHASLAAARAPLVTFDAAAELPRAPTPRRIVVIDAFSNASGDPRIDGVPELLLASGLECSVELDAYAPSTLPVLAEEIGVNGDTPQPTEIAARAVADGRAVVVVKGSVAPADAGTGLRVSLDVVDAAHTKTLAHLEGFAADGSAIASTTATLGLEVRNVLGIEPKSDGDPPSSYSSSLDALAAWQDARTSMARRSWLEAIDAGARALAADPAFVLARADYAFSLTRESRSVEAEENYVGALSHEGALCERQRLKGRSLVYSLQFRHPAAAHMLEHYLRLWPRDLQVETWVTTLLLDDRDWRVGLEVARSAAAEHPRALLARASYVSALFLSGDNDGVAREGELLYSLSPRPPQHEVQRLIVSNTFLGRDAAAMQSIRRQAVYDAEMSDEEEADVDLFHGRLDHAEALLRHQIAALTAHDDVTYARTENIMLAQLLLRRGDLPAANRVASIALMGAPEELTVPMLYDLGRVFLAAHADRSDATIAERLATYATPTGRMFGTLFEGDRLRARGKLDEAAAHYADAARVDDRWIVHERIGELSFERGAWADAERELGLCIERRAEGTVYFEPGLHYLSEPYLDFARAKDRAKRADAAAAYRAFLLLEPDPEHDPFADLARRRLQALDPQ